MGEVGQLVLCIIFSALSLLHILWAMGMKWGIANAVPTTNDGTKVLDPGRLSCSVVGFGLGLFAALYLLLFLNNSIVSDQLRNLSVWPVPIIFLIRTIGDFKYVGLFKKVKNTSFGKLDSYFIIPLCLVITILGFSVIFR